MAGADNNVVDSGPTAFVAWFSSFKDRPYLTAAEVGLRIPRAPAFRS